jgi:hypothetical protein
MHLGAQARIVDDEACVTECRLIDLSDNGARLELPHGSRVKNQFTLHIANRGVERRVEVVWRNRHQVGVHFLFETQAGTEGPATPASRPLSIDQLRKLVKR